MTKKKIIGLCIGAVVLAVAAAGVKEGSWLMKHRRMQNEFTHEMNAFTTKTNAELIQPTIVAEDDIYGWFSMRKIDGLYMNLYYRIKKRVPISTKLIDPVEISCEDQKGASCG